MIKKALEIRYQHFKPVVLKLFCTLTSN